MDVGQILTDGALWQKGKSMSDLISRQAALKICRKYWHPTFNPIMEEIEQLPFVQSEIIHCKDCKYYTPMDRETKTGICNLTIHQNFGDDWFCAGAERKTDE